MEHCPNNWKALRWILFVTLLHGLIYLVIVPPWQHYDEPTHFEYAHQIAETGVLPTLETITPETRWQIAESMWRFHFWDQQEPSFRRSSDLAQIGYDQRVHPPLYYSLAALPIRATLGLPVELRLYATRLLSVLFYTLAVAAVWRMSTVLAPERPLMQIVVPLSYAAVPPFAAIMSAVNNDVLVNFTGTTLLLGCVLLIRDGPRPTALVLAVLSLLVGVFAKRTALIGVLPFGFALFWAFVRRPVPLWRSLLFLGTIILVGAVATLRMNTSGATWTLGLRAWVNTLAASYLRLNLDLIARSLSDWKLGATVYPNYFSVAFTSFWATYGWGHVQIGRGWEWALLAISVAALIGLGRRPLRAAETPLWQRRMVWLFLVVAIMGIVAMILRLHPLPAYGGPAYVPHGRYMFSGLAATIWLIVLGLMGLLPRQREHNAALAFFVFMLVFESFGLVRLIAYY